MPDSPVAKKPKATKPKVTKPKAPKKVTAAGDAKKKAPAKKAPAKKKAKYSDEDDVSSFAGSDDDEARPAGPSPAKQSIEQIYQKKTQLEHILLRPDTYGTLCYVIERFACMLEMVYRRLIALLLLFDVQSDRLSR